MKVHFKKQGALMAGFLVFTSIALLLAPSAPAIAALSSDVAENVVTAQTATLSVGSAGVAALGLNVVVSAGETLKNVRAEISPESAGFLSSDLAAASTTASAGVGLYLDNKSGGVTGSFDSTDTFITPSTTPYIARPGVGIHITPSATAVVADTAMNIAVGDIAFTALGTSGYNWHMVTTGNSSSGGVASTALRLDDSASAPSYTVGAHFSKLTPVSANSYIINGVSNTTGLTPGDVIAYDGGFGSSTAWGVVTAWTASTASVGGAPLAHNSYHISKVAGASDALTVPTSGSITNVNSVAFAVGDAVIYKRNSDQRYSWGIITDATATAGTFAISGVPLNADTWSVAKITGYTPTSIAITDNATTLHAGDLMLDYTTKNPQNSDFVWNIVTTDGTISGGTLRYNDKSAAPVHGYAVLIQAATGQAIPADNTGANAGDDFFIVVRTAANANNGSQFSVSIASADVGYSSGNAFNTPNATTSNTFTIDGLAPWSNSVAPGNGATNVPIGTFVNVGFSENINPSTVTSSSLALSTGGTPVPASLRIGPNNVTVVPSVAPTLTGSKFGKFGSTAYTYLNISNTPGATITTNGGTYTSPQAGDIVYFQRDSFPPELGMITNATLTSGNFSINGLPLFGTIVLTKMKSAAATALVSASNVIMPGDLVVAFTTSSPTNFKYGWHVATAAAGQAVNSASFRLDSSGSAPAYFAGSQFAEIPATASSTVNGSGNVTSLTLTAGDFVFANISSNATTGDNVGSYGWHIVTTGEVLSSAAPSTLRLDNGSAAPTFANNSIISVIGFGSTGPTDGSDTTALSIGDLIFARTSAGSGTNGSFAYHMVTAPGLGISNAGVRLDNASSQLTPSTLYTLTVSTGISDVAGNAATSTKSYTFTTSAQTGTNDTHPYVTSAVPQAGTQSYPIDYPIKIVFDRAMTTAGGGSVTADANVGVFTSSFGAAGATITTTKSYDSTTKTLTITPSSNLTASTDYVVRIASSTTASLNSLGLANDYLLAFHTSSGVATTTPPTVAATFPQKNATNVSTTVPSISAVFSKDMDPTTVLGANAVFLTPAVTASIKYDPGSRTVTLLPGQALSPSTVYTLTVKNTVTDLGAINLDSDLVSGGNQDYTVSFTTSATPDTTKPSIVSALADNQNLAITFSKAMKADDGSNSVANITNYTLESPVGTSLSLAGKLVSYDGTNMTAHLGGLALQNGVDFKLTASNLLQDIAGNYMATSTGQNIVYGTVSNVGTTGGQLSGQQQGAAMQGMTPVQVSPANRTTGATSNFMVQFPVSTVVPLGGSIVLTFPNGFDVTNAAALAAGTVSMRNTDINGPAPGTITFTIGSVDPVARTITIVTAGSATGSNDFISFELGGIVNTTIANSSGYTVDIRTRDTPGNNNTVLETKTSAPFFLGQSGAITLTLNVFNDNGAGGGTAGNNVKDGSEAGVAGARLYVFSPAMGSMTTTTLASGVATLANLSAGDYQVAIDPQSVSSGNYVVNPSPQQITIGADKSVSFGLTASTLSIAGSITGPANAVVDVFGSNENGFTKTTVTLNGSGAGTYSLPVSANTTYSVGVGPSIPSTYSAPGAPPPPPPTFTFMPPANIQVNVAAANVTGQDFTLTTAGKTITGTVHDSAGSAISGAGIFARPISGSTGGDALGFGTGAQTDATGAFTLNVVPGTYVVGVFKPGMPNVPDQQISVPASGANSPTALAFKLGTAASVTITGTIKDDSGNAIPYAGVSASKVVSTSDATILGGGAANFIGGPADSNGAYTLYVTAGTWKVEAFAPGFGRLGSKTITISDSTSVSGQDFSAQTLSFGTVTGQALAGGTATQGVQVRLQDGTGANMGVTDATGNYSLKVPAGTYTMSCFFPGYGDGTPVTGIVVTANGTASGNDCVAATPITLTVNVTDGANPITDAFVDVRDSSGRGNGTNSNITSGINGVYTVSVPAGTYTVRVGSQRYGYIGTTTGISTTQALTFTASGGAGFAVTGTVTAGGSPVSGAWVNFNGTATGQTAVIQNGALTDATGAFSITLPKGRYDVRVTKPGYVGGAAQTVTVTGAAAIGAFAITATSYTISGTATVSGSGVSGAFVDASNGSGGFTVAQTDSSGAYSLSVGNGTWTLHARSAGYESSGTSVTVSGSSVSGQNISLSAISGYTVAAQKQENVTPTAGASLTNADIGSAFKVNIPANALGNTSNAGTVNTQPNTAVPNASNGTILSKNAVTISAVDSSGSPIKSLNGSVTVVVPYTSADIPAGGSASDLVVATWNDATQSWDSLPTTVDTTAGTLTAATTHFSDFAPMLPSGATPAAVVSTPASTNSGGGGGGGCVICGPGPVLGGTQVVQTAPVTVPVAAPTEVVAAPVPVYSFTRTLGVGAKGTDVTALQTFLESKGVLVMPKGVAKGLFGALTRSAITAYQKSVGLKQTGTFDATTKAKVSAEYVVPAISVPTTTTPAAAPAATQAPVFTRTLGVGAKGTDVTALQTFLESKGVLVIPKGVAKGLFGALTRKAITAYQKSVGLKQTGTFDAATKAKVSAEYVVPAVSAPATTTPVTTQASVFTRTLDMGAKGADVTALQTFLESKGVLVIPKGVAKGLFGALTRSAITAYQKSVGLKQTGTFDAATRSAVQAAY